MNMPVSRESAALNAGQRIVHGMTMAAGAIVAISGVCAAVGLAFAFGYLTTIGAPWARELLQVTTLVQFGAPFASVLGTVTIVALFVHGRSGRLPRARTVILSWLLWMVVSTVVATLIDWSLAYFLVVVGCGLAVGLLAPVYLIGLAETWAGHRIGVLAMLMNAVALATIAPVTVGVMKGFADRAEPGMLAKVLMQADDSDWRLVLALNDRLLLTRIDDGKAFRVYRLVALEQIEAIQSTRAGAPWAP